MPWCRTLVVFFCVTTASAQFLYQFNRSTLTRDPRGINGWSCTTGDGDAVMDFQQRDGFASIVVDARRDQRGIWWSLIKHMVSGQLDLGRLQLPRHALRIEARVRVSDAPKRVNLHLNTQRTTDFHTHLMEFDISDTVNWHTISMTTQGFDARPGDTVYGQLALMDWGLEQYRVDVQYFKVDVVHLDSVGTDAGVAVPYHPTVQDPSSFPRHEVAAQDAVIDLQYPGLGFPSWSAYDAGAATPVISVDATRYVILRWDLRGYAGRKVAGAGLLDLTTYALERAPQYEKDFGMVRVCEIRGGDGEWKEADVSLNSICQGLPLQRVINSQMIIDGDVQGRRGERNLYTISEPVVQRMIDGKTLGIAIKPLGGVHASFFSHRGRHNVRGPMLHLRLQGDPPEISVPAHREG